MGKRNKKVPSAVYRSALSRVRTTLKKLERDLHRELHAIGEDPRTTNETKQNLHRLFIAISGFRCALEVK